MVRVTAFAVLLVVLAAPAWAGWDEGVAAYERGDDATALREFRVLAEQGNASAQFSLARLYRQGRGVTQDYAKAVRWYRKAANQGYAGAQASLGFMYDKGQGVPQDYVEAHMWFNLAAAGSPPGEVRDMAATNRDMVAKLMTPAQIAEAQRFCLACGQETRPRCRNELGMVRKHRGGARGAGVFGSTPTHRGWGQFVTSREIDRRR